MRARLGAAVIVALLATSGVVAAATAGSDPPRTLSLTFSEWRIGLGRDTVAAGPVELTEHNAGAVEHDLVVVRTGRAADDLPRGLSGPRPDLAGEIVLGELHGAHEHGAQAVAEHHLAPGAERRRTVRLRPGRYVALCSLEGHYEAGQRVAFRVR